jgi:hemoglobin
MNTALAVATPYARIGGAVMVDRLVEALYAHMDALPEAKSIRALSARDLSPPRPVEATSASCT